MKVKIKILMITSFIFSANLIYGASSKQKVYQFKNYGQIRSYTRKLKEKKLIKTLREFVSCCSPNRFVLSKGNAQAKNYLLEKIKKLDPNQQGKLQEHSFYPDVDWAIKVYERDFSQKVGKHFRPGHKDYKRWRQFTDHIQKMLRSVKKKKFSNIIWEKRGAQRPEKVLFVIAHYDSIVFDQKKVKILVEGPSQGANDNGSGVALLLEYISLLRHVDLPYTVRFLFSNFQEMGSLGAMAYIKDHVAGPKKQALEFLGAINLLMLAYDTKSKDKLRKQGNMKIYTKNGPANGAFANRILAAGKPVARLEMTILKNNFDLSDHIHFWKQKIPAVVIGQDWENDYDESLHHSINDFVEVLNPRTYHAMGRFALAAILSLASGQMP